MNTNSYVPLYHPPEERDFFTYLDDIKHVKVMKDPDYFIKNAWITDFDIIYHENSKFLKILPNFKRK